MTVLMIAACLTVLISSACSFFEAVLYSVRMGALEAERAQGKHSALADRLIYMKSNIAEPTSAILVLNTVANTAGATLCGMYATQVLLRWRFSSLVRSFRRPTVQLIGRGSGT